MLVVVSFFLEILFALIRFVELSLAREQPSNEMFLFREALQLSQLITRGMEHSLSKVLLQPRWEDELEGYAVYVHMAKDSGKPQMNSL